MSTINLTRFQQTRSGYQRIDTFEIESGDEAAKAMTLTAEEEARLESKQAWSFCHFLSGKMSSETWKYASAITLEWHLDCQDTPDMKERMNEVLIGAEKLNIAYYAMTTQTRYKEPTITLLFPLSEPVAAAKYSRLASVLATQIGVYEAATGILAHTHLVHLTPGTVVTYREGLTINPHSYILTTKKDAQLIDPLQFERRRPRMAAHLDRPKLTCCDDGLFEGL